MPTSPPSDSSDSSADDLPFAERSDAELVAAAKRDDADAMEALFLRYRDFAYRTAYGIVGNPEDALEVVQDVFQKFFRKLDGFTLRGKFTTYLYPIVRNRSIDRLRKRKPTLELLDVYAAPPQRDEAREQQALFDLVSGLPEKQRDVVILRFGQGYKVEEIAELLDIAPGTVKSRLHTAMATLREQLSDSSES